MMFMTAYSALIEDAKLSSQDAVLINAASSSVGLAAIQLANMAGATPVAFTRTSVKRQKLLDAGAKHVIATEEQDAAAEVMKITDGKGARVVFDPVGGPGFLKLMEALTIRGIAYLYGGLSEQARRFRALNSWPTFRPSRGIISGRPAATPFRKRLASTTSSRVSRAVS
jgi:NADPH:quinone reductase-like Zn-dependent oxidoreductase